MPVFEAVMLTCFGIGWPVSIAKSLRTKVVVGKSPLFMTIIILGYASGITHKMINDYNWVVWLYAANLVLVAVDMALYFKYLPRQAAPDPTPS